MCFRIGCAAWDFCLHLHFYLLFFPTTLRSGAVIIFPAVLLTERKARSLLSHNISLLIPDITGWISHNQLCVPLFSDFIISYAVLIKSTFVILRSFRNALISSNKSRGIIVPKFPLVCLRLSVAFLVTSSCRSARRCFFLFHSNSPF